MPLIRFPYLRLLLAGGRVLIPAAIEKTARGESPDQRTPPDYSLPPGLVDEQGRASRIPSALARTFEPVRARTNVDALGATSGRGYSSAPGLLGYADVMVCQEARTQR